MKASDIMYTGTIWTCSQQDSIQDAAKRFCEHHVGSLPVVNEQQQVQGMVTDRDICCRAVSKGLGNDTSISQIMTRECHCVHPGDDLKQIEQIMEQHKVRRLPVVDDSGRIQGMISLADLARHCQGRQEECEIAEVVAAVSEPTPSSKV